MRAADRLDAPHGPDGPPETARTIPYPVAFGVIYVGAIDMLKLRPMLFWLPFVGLFAARKHHR